MKAQYFGDVNDYSKFALLRYFALKTDLRPGICWMMTAPDESDEGGKRSFLRQPSRWRHYDPQLFDVMSKIPACPVMADLRRVEHEGLIPGATFFDDVVSDDLASRNAFHQACLARFAATDLVFFDPDNGLEVQSVVKGRRRSSKFVFMDEITDHYAQGRSVIVYQHFPRKERSEFIQYAASRMHYALSSSRVWAFETAHVLFLLAAQPCHAATVAAIAPCVEAAWNGPLFRSARRLF